MAAHKMKWVPLCDLTAALPKGVYWGQFEEEDIIETGTFHWDGTKWQGGHPDFIGTVIGLPVKLCGDEDEEESNEEESLEQG